MTITVTRNYWLVYFSIGLIDPYYDWPMTTDQFNAFILQKYGSYEAAVETIHHYEYNPLVDSGDHDANYMPGYQMTATTYSFLPPERKYQWVPVSEYDYQFKRNENKRAIQLLDSRLKDQVVREISTILKK